MASTIENHFVALTPFCAAVKGGTKKINVYRAGFNYTEIFFFFFLLFFFCKERKEKQGKKKHRYCIAVSQRPHNPPGLSASFLHPSLAAILRPPDGPAADTSQACRTTILGSLLSVLRAVGGKSLCSMERQRAGDILQAVELAGAVLPCDVLPVGAAWQGHHGAQ